MNTYILHKSVLKALKFIVQSTSIISISVDEVTSINNTTWVGVHVYIVQVQSWKRVRYLLHLSIVSENGGADALIEIIIRSLMNEDCREGSEGCIFWSKQSEYFPRTHQ